FVREPDVHLEPHGIRRQGTRRRRGNSRSLAADDARAVGPNRSEPFQTKLTRGKSTLVDLELGDPPVVVGDGLQPLVQEALVIAVLLLEVVLADQQTFGPKRFVRHVPCSRSRASARYRPESASDPGTPESERPSSDTAVPCGGERARR